MQLFNIHAKYAQIQQTRTELSTQNGRKWAESGRTSLSRILSVWYLDGLFGIVDALWPVVIERLELHG